MNGTMKDIQEILFDQLLRITNDDLEGDALDKEISRVDAVVKITESMTHNAELQLKAAKFMSDNGYGGVKEAMPELLVSPHDSDEEQKRPATGSRGSW